MAQQNRTADPPDDWPPLGVCSPVQADRVASNNPCASRSALALAKLSLTEAASFPATGFIGCEPDETQLYGHL